MSAAAFFPDIPNAPSAWNQLWAQRLSEVVGRLVIRANNLADLTLDASATSTTMLDPRLSATSILTFMATTANAAAVQSGIYVTGQKKGEAVIHHASDVNTDKTFRVAIHG